MRMRRRKRFRPGHSSAAVAVWVVAAVCVAVVGCGFSTDPAERPLEGTWLGAVSLIDGGVSWQLWLREDGRGDVSGRVSRTDFRRIPHPAEEVSHGTVRGVHEPSRVLLTPDYGESSEIYDGRVRSDDRITGFIERGTMLRSIGTLEFRRILLRSADAKTCNQPLGRSRSEKVATPARCASSERSHNLAGPRPVIMWPGSLHRANVAGYRARWIVTARRAATAHPQRSLHDRSTGPHAVRPHLDGLPRHARSRAG